MDISNDLSFNGDRIFPFLSQHIVSKMDHLEYLVKIKAEPRSSDF